MITRHRLLFLVGIWIVLIPFLGFPTSYKSFFVIVSGLFVAAIAFSSARVKRLTTRRTRTPAPRREPAKAASPVVPEPEISIVPLQPDTVTDIETPTT